jgi:hypothetical protein
LEIKEESRNDQLREINIEDDPYLTPQKLNKIDPDKPRSPSKQCFTISCLETRKKKKMKLNKLYTLLPQFTNSKSKLKISTTTFLLPYLTPTNAKESSKNMKARKFSKVF